MPVGLLLFALGGAKAISDITKYDFHIATDTLLILFAAFQVIVIGLLADLVVRLSKDRDEVAPASVSET
jgi:protoheme ferro-lyase